MAERFGCERCFPGSAEAAWAARGSLDLVAKLVDESHFMVNVLACHPCGQRFLSVFTETIDWQDGEDPQYSTLMPITADESDALVGGGDSLDVNILEALGPGRASLRFDHPKDRTRRIYFSTGLRIGPHD